MKTTLHIRAEELRPEHLGHDIAVEFDEGPHGKEGLHLTVLEFRPHDVVIVRGPDNAPTFVLDATTKVEVYAWDGGRS
jgi:FAD synthase